LRGVGDEESNQLFTGSTRTSGQIGIRAAKEHESEWSEIKSIASKIGCTAETLRTCVRRAETDQGIRSGISTSDREKLKELERENRELKRANEILRKASVYFAQAGLDRRPK